MDFGKKIMPVLFALLVSISSLTTTYNLSIPTLEKDTISNQTIQELLEGKNFCKYFESGTKRLSSTLAKLTLKSLSLKNLSVKWFGLPCYEQAIVTLQRCYFFMERSIQFKGTTRNLIFPFNYFW